jgi:hypothetical protein
VKGVGATILQDAATRPELFWRVGALDASALDSWLAKHTLNMPDDLIAFWRATGGGIAFETEELLAPMAEARDSESLWARNEWYRSQGMPARFVVFHEGAWLSAVRAPAPRYVTLTSRYVVEKAYPSLEEWYRLTLRAEYAERYGLTMWTP